MAPIGKILAFLGFLGVIIFLIIAIVSLVKKMVRQKEILLSQGFPLYYLL